MSKRFRKSGRLEKSLRKRNRGLLVWNEKQPSSLGSDASNVPVNPQLDSTQLAPIHGVVHGLAEWLNRAPLQVMSSRT